MVCVKHVCELHFEDRPEVLVVFDSLVHIRKMTEWRSLSVQNFIPMGRKREIPKPTCIQRIRVPLILGAVSSSACTKHKLDYSNAEQSRRTQKRPHLCVCLHRSTFSTDCMFSTYFRALQSNFLHGSWKMFPTLLTLYRLREKSKFKKLLKWGRDSGCPPAVMWPNLAAFRQVNFNKVAKKTS